MCLVRGQKLHPGRSTRVSLRFAEAIQLLEIELLTHEPGHSDSRANAPHLRAPPPPDPTGPPLHRGPPPLSLLPEPPTVTIHSFGSFLYYHLVR